MLCLDQLLECLDLTGLEVCLAEGLAPVVLILGRCITPVLLHSFEEDYELLFLTLEYMG